MVKKNPSFLNIVVLKNDESENSDSDSEKSEDESDEKSDSEKSDSEEDEGSPSFLSKYTKLYKISKDKRKITLDMNFNIGSMSIPTAVISKTSKVSLKIKKIHNAEMVFFGFVKKSQISSFDLTKSMDNNQSIYGYNPQQGETCIEGQFQPSKYGSPISFKNDNIFTIKEEKSKIYFSYNSKVSKWILNKNG